MLLQTRYMQFEIRGTDIPERENCRKECYKRVWSFPFLRWPVTVTLKCSYCRPQGAYWKFQRNV